MAKARGNVEGMLSHMCVSDITSSLSYRLNHLVLQRLTPAADPVLDWYLHRVSMRAIARVAHNLLAAGRAVCSIKHVACSFIEMYLATQRNTKLRMVVRIYVSIMVYILCCQTIAYGIETECIYIQKTEYIFIQKYTNLLAKARYTTCTRAQRDSSIRGGNKNTPPQTCRNHQK